MSVPVLAAAHLLAGHEGIPPDITITVHELMNNDSAGLTQADMEDIRTAVASALLSPDIDAVVVLHGTDTMEETAFFLQGALVEEGPTQQIFVNPKEKLTHEYVSGRFG